MAPSIAALTLHKLRCVLRLGRRRYESGLRKLRGTLLRQALPVYTAWHNRLAGNLPDIHPSRLLPIPEADAKAQTLRRELRIQAGLAPEVAEDESLEALLQEVRYILTRGNALRSRFRGLSSKRMLFSGQTYYNGWYLTRGLRDQGWRADLLNWDLNEHSQIFYHGEDFRFTAGEPYDLRRDLKFYVEALYRYDVFHFCNAFGMCFGYGLQDLFARQFGQGSEIILLKTLGKKILYINNGCLDGVSQTSFSSWGEESICSICRWQNEPSVCSDARNLAWGEFRNRMADYQSLLGGNRIDYNHAPTVHESPQAYCIDPDVWRPDLDIPDTYRLPAQPAGTLWLYHAVGNRKERTREDGKNIKSSHIWLPIIDQLKAEGVPLSLLEPTGIPNRDVRFVQLQADIFLEMLSYGFFGANVREAMMLGKPVICYIRPEWMETMRREIPGYVDELPIVQATPETAEQVLRDLIAHPEKRRIIGEKSRAFAIKWHSKDEAGRHFDRVYRELLKGNKLLLEAYA